MKKCLLFLIGCSYVFGTEPPKYPGFSKSYEARLRDLPDDPLELKKIVLSMQEKEEAKRRKVNDLERQLEKISDRLRYIERGDAGKDAMRYMSCIPGHPMSARDIAASQKSATDLRHEKERLRKQKEELEKAISSLKSS